MSTPTYGTLCFNSVSLDSGPNFKCPQCKQRFSPSQWSTIRLVLKPTTPDFNAKVAFPCPNCGSKIELFTALHYFAADNIALCLQKSVEEGANGIPFNWWQ